MRKHLPIVLASAAVLACATAGTATAAPGTTGSAGGDVKNLPSFVKRRQGEKQAAADLVARGQATPNAKGVQGQPEAQLRQDGGSGVRLRILDATDDRTRYVVQVDPKQ